MSAQFEGGLRANRPVDRACYRRDRCGCPRGECHGNEHYYRHIENGGHDAASYYTVPLLPPGSYQITVQKPDFKAVTRSGIVLELEQRAAVDFTLEIGRVTQSVEITADAPTLNTVDASQGQVIENRRVVDLPLNGREYIQLALLASGTA